MSHRRVPCQRCGNLPGLRETCPNCNGIGGFVVDDEEGQDPNRYGPNGEVGPRPPAPGLWASAGAPAPVPAEPDPAVGVPVIAATASGTQAIQPKSAREANME